MKLFDGVSATIWRMGLSQALMMTVMNVNLTNTALVGSLLAPSPWLITLPLSIQFIAVMIATIPASLLMAKFGRRPVFLAGVIVVSIGAFGQALSILTGSFIPLVFSSFLVGLGQGVAQFYRYAAADT
ncbi:sugar porter family MFS transporter, partial [Alphaproteobacteria bacterium]|nr:sugar porter family MFS transporter [Alphaproteobacteria bacterium]